MPSSREPHSRKSFRLITLGSAALLEATGSRVAEQRRRLALLALVASSGERGISRDRPIAALSPESSTESARHALHKLLYYLRQQLGDDTSSAQIRFGRTGSLSPSMWRSSKR